MSVSDILGLLFQLPVVAEIPLKDVLRFSDEICLTNGSWNYKWRTPDDNAWVKIEKLWLHISVH